MSDASSGLDMTGCLLDESAKREALLQLRRESGHVAGVYREVERVARRLADGDTPAGGLSKPRAQVRLGVACWILGDTERAVEVLESAPSSAERDYFLALSCLEADRPTRSIELLQPLVKKDAGTLDISLALARAKAVAGKAEEAWASIEKLAGAGERDPEYRFVEGYCLEHLGRSAEAVAAYQKALDLDPDHGGALFRLAAHYAFVDENDKALEYYDRLRDGRVFYPNALLNLGVLYEDLGKVNRAIECYKAVLDRRPRDWRARLYLKDAEATLNMYYDEGVARRVSRQWEVLSQPISDFELSARSRNCLEKMEIHTLGDLVSKTEEELLAYKNFGETSLLEIKQLLMEKGVSLGQEVALPSSGVPRTESLPVTDTSYQEDILRCPVTELKLSVRSQACMDRLGIVTIQDLVAKTADDLMAVRNFGKISLDEIEERLAGHGLSLKQEKES